MRILIDIDGVLAAWGKAYDNGLNRFHEADAIPRHAARVKWDLMDGLSSVERTIASVVLAHGIDYAQLEVLEGAVEAVHEIEDAGHDVWIVSTPWPGHKTCTADKAAWVRRVLGLRWERRLILTHDKTLVRGDVLIDDKPEIKGAATPEWTHVLFTQPYNLDRPGPPRINKWSEWRTVLEGLNK